MRKSNGLRHCWNNIGRLPVWAPLVMVLLPLLYCGVTAGAQDMRGLVQQVKEQYASDKRTVLFDVSLEKKGAAWLLRGETSSTTARAALLQALDSAGIAAKDELNLLPGDDVGEEIYALARLSVCNLRVHPGHSEELATQVLMGTPLKVLKDEGSWLLVQSPEEYIAWTQASGLMRMSEAGLAEWKSRDKLMVTSYFGQAFAAPDGTEVVSDLVIGDLLELLESNRDYYKARTPDGRTAWIRKADALPLKDWMAQLQPSGESVLNVAQQLTGVPYLWGGTSAKGVDCSGFTKTAYFMNGIILPRDASQQVLAGEEVPIYEQDTVSIRRCLQNLKKGDLIFFTSDPEFQHSEDPRITHVGIYIENGEFIHSSGFVHRSSLLEKAPNYSAHHAHTLVKARRMLKHAGENGTFLLGTHPLYSIHGGMKQP